MLALSARIEGKRPCDLELALEETLRLVRQGFTSGKDRNEDGNLFFTICGQEEGPPSTSNGDS